MLVQSACIPHDLPLPPPHLNLSMTNPRQIDLCDLGMLSLPVVFGRSEDADVQICDRWVSRRHCIIEMVEDGLQVRDLEAKHGTFVNGAQIEKAELASGDEIAIGLTRLQVESAHGHLQVRLVGVNPKVADYA